MGRLMKTCKDSGFQVFRFSVGRVEVGWANREAYRRQKRDKGRHVSRKEGLRYANVP
jgi:hypothetical protein